MAFDDNALFGFDCLDDLWQQEIPPGDNELILRWNDSALEKKIVRMSMSKFREIFKSTLQNADYFVGGSVHQIRRCLGKKVDGKLFNAWKLFSPSFFLTFFFRAVYRSGTFATYFAVRSTHLRTKLCRKLLSRGRTSRFS
jgi:hypothetical protein